MKPTAGFSLLQVRLKLIHNRKHNYNNDYNYVTLALYNNQIISVTMTGLEVLVLYIIILKLTNDYFIPKAP